MMAPGNGGRGGDNGSNAGNAGNAGNTATTIPDSSSSTRGTRVTAIAIGASAGGVDALTRILPSLSARLPVPVFVVLHLPRDRASLLVEIFSPICALPVREPDDKDPIVSGTIYFAPPDYHLQVDARGSMIVLSADDEVNFSRPSIDVLFASAAEVYGAGLVGVILTGANHDGAAGLKAICDAGGQVLVQQPEGAYAWLMPQSAIQACPEAKILTIAEIATLLQVTTGAIDA